MKNQLLKHKWAYLILAIELIAFLLLFYIAWPNKLLQRGLIVLMMAFYIAWGSITHVKTSYLTRKVLLEYIAVSLIAGLLLFLITL